MKNKIRIILVFIANLLPVTKVLAEVSAQTSTTTAIEEVTKNSSEISFVLQKFGLAIGVCLLCIIALVGILIIYKKIARKNNQTLHLGERDNSLDTPDNLEDSIKSFLEKTKPNI